MAETHVVSQLIDKYREISGQVVACEMQVARFQSQLDNLRAVIYMFNPDADLKHLTPKRPIRTVFRHNMFLRTAMDILRESPTPLTSPEITASVFEAQSVVQDAKTVKRFVKLLDLNLAQKFKEGVVTCDGEKFPKRWEVKR